MVLRPEAIVEAVEALLADGVDAIGGVSVIEGVTEEMFVSHQRGEIPNPSGGVEAIITHLVSKLFRVPTAHAPLPYYQDTKPRSRDNPRVAAELISTPHYFSVLKGLARAADRSAARCRRARGGDHAEQRRRGGGPRLLPRRCARARRRAQRHPADRRARERARCST